jgi:hypothetical protein
MPNQMILVNGRKLMWDGVDYPDREKTSEAANRYKTDGFEVELFDEDGKTYLYTRRDLKKGAVPDA